MKTKVIIFQLFFTILVAPLTLFAQELETTISADSITVQPNNILEANGNVIVKRGNVSIKAEAISVNEETNQIEVQEISEFSDGQSLKLAGKNANLSDDLSAGIINAAQVLIDDTIRFQAEEITLKNSAIDHAEKIDRITSCEECESGFPLWHFTASSATNDLENQNIVYRNVTLRASGVPIGYIPYLRLPNPSVERARGFLIPGLKITSNLGVGATLPYFIPIGESRDLLLTPYISPKTKTIEYRYRQKLNDGDIAVSGAISQDEVTDKNIKGYYKARGNFKLAYGINLKIQAAQTNDEKYLSDYLYGSSDDLNTQIQLTKSKVNSDNLFSGDLSYIRDEKDDNTLEEFYSVSGAYKKRINQTLFPGNLFLGVEGNSALNVAQGSQISRPPSSVSSEIRYSNTRYAGPVQMMDQSFVRLSSFVNSKNIEAWQEEFIANYGISTTLAVPLYQKRDTFISEFVPKIMLSFNGQEGKIKGNYFVGDNHLSFGNLYARKKLISSSESELGFSASVSADYHLDWNDGRSLGFWFGGLWIQDSTMVQNETGSFQPKSFNYVGGVEYNVNNNFSINGNTVISDQGKILETDLISEIHLKEFNVNGRYEFIDAKADSRITENLESLTFSASYSGFENFSASATRRYDISENVMASSESSLNAGFSNGFWNYQLAQTFDGTKPDKVVLSAIYDDNCTRLTLSLEDASQSIASFDSIQSLTILVQLKPFASFTVPGF